VSTELDSITIYPIKACRGVRVQSAELVARGLADDRRYMLVDEAGRFITQRDEHSLARVDVEREGSGWRLTASGLSPLFLAPSVGQGQLLPVEVWRSTVAARVVPDASEWFSSFLGRACRLVYFPDLGRRAVEHERGHSVAFQDAYPFLVISLESLADLNRRVAAPLEMERFRPNLVIRGVEAYAEESWTRFRIGQADFRMTRPCVRCVVTTLDPRSGERDTEPLRTLSGYHTYEGRPAFGMNAVHESVAPIRVGEPLIFQ
jgi:uncharacterized protein YcbX